MKRLGFVMAALALVAVLVFAWLWRLSEAGADAVHAQAPVASAEATTLVARGAYLAKAGNCALCHTVRGGPAYAGGRAIDTPFGTLYTSNLTPAPRTGLGAWTAQDFWRALHHGRSRDGRMLYPAFPYTNYTRVTRADSDAMFAYLRSLPPVERDNLPHALSWPVRTQAALGVWRALYFRPGAQPVDATQTPEWNRGAYLVQGLGHCSACHSARDALGGSNLMDLSGGMIPMQNWYAPSLASRTEAGVADWSVADIVQFLHTGRAGPASALGPMAEVVLHSTQHLSEADLQAMAVFLKAIPQTQTSAEAPATARVVSARGERVYGEQCAQCHGDRGQGVPGAYPPLDGNRAVLLPQTANLVQAVIYGGFAPATDGNPRPYGMPPFAVVLGDADVAAVLTYIRNAWGQSAGPVSELDVARQRGSRP
jgi:mono/diheme cytochrome c family protein